MLAAYRADQLVSLLLCSNDEACRQDDLDLGMYKISAEAHAHLIWKSQLPAHTSCKAISMSSVVCQSLSVLWCMQAIGLTLLIFVAWPLLTLPAGIFSRAYFRFWIVLAMVWGTLAGMLSQHCL